MVNVRIFYLIDYYVRKLCRFYFICVCKFLIKFVLLWWVLMVFVLLLVSDEVFLIRLGWRVFVDYYNGKYK